MANVNFRKQALEIIKSHGNDKTLEVRIFGRGTDQNKELKARVKIFKSGTGYRASFRGGHMGFFYGSKDAKEGLLVNKAKSVGDVLEVFIKDSTERGFQTIELVTAKKQTSEEKENTMKEKLSPSQEKSVSGALALEKTLKKGDRVKVKSTGLGQSDSKWNKGTVKAIRKLDGQKTRFGFKKDYEIVLDKQLGTVFQSADLIQQISEGDSMFSEGFDQVNEFFLRNTKPPKEIPNRQYNEQADIIKTFECAMGDMSAMIAQNPQAVNQNSIDMNGVLQRLYEIIREIENVKNR